MEVVSHAAEDSMYSAVEEVQSLPHYVDQGEVLALITFFIIVFIANMCL